MLPGKFNNKNILLDIRYKKNTKKIPLILFVHGFKGFKDWGHWNMIADLFSENGFAFAKLNLSHNGTTVEDPADFNDLEAFSKNTFTIELSDLKVAIDYFFDENPYSQAIDTTRFGIIGHSRGGGLVLLMAHEDKRIKSIATWASVSNFGERWPKEVIGKWKEDGVYHVYNGRTKQNMPMRYDIVEDYYANESRLLIDEAVKSLTIPQLIIHGTEDPTVPVEEALELKKWNENAQLEIINRADHVFGGKHPFTEKGLPSPSQKLLKKTLSFFNDSLG